MQSIPAPDTQTEQMDGLQDPSIAALYAYWTRQRGNAAAPRRSAIAPADIAPLLGDVFILDASRDGRFPFRLAGTRLCAAFGREMRDDDFLALWQRRDLARIAAEFRAVIREAAATRLRAAGANDRGQAVDVEILLLPLSQDGRSIDRVLGLLAPLERPYWLDLHPIRRLDLLDAHRLSAGEAMATLAHAAPVGAPRPSVADPVASESAAEVPRRPRLVVLEGGRR